MKAKINDLWKGFLLGLDTTIPGFSIGTLAIILGIYERMIDGLSGVVKHPLKVLKEDWALVVGFLIGFAVDIALISFLLERFPLQTVITFVGLLLVSIPFQLKNGIKSKPKTDKKQSFVGEIVCCVIALMILVGVTLLNGASGEKEATFSIGYIIAMVACGMIGAGLMIVPGISGSLIVMSLGYYDNIILMLKGFAKSLITQEFDGFWVTSLYILCFVIGCLIGLIGIAKAIKKLLEVKPSYVYFTILGLLLGSPFAILYLTINNYSINWSSPWTYIASVLTFSFGAFFGILVKKIEDKQEKKETQEKLEEKNDDELVEGSSNESQNV